MSSILRNWLNQELNLSKTVDAESVAKDFSNGYLIGEILHKYQLQDDFGLFTKKDTAISKVNNFRRLEPTLKLLGIYFDKNTAQDLIEEKQGAATHLLHQLYVSLEKKKSEEVSRTMMEVMQPEARANMHKQDHEIYSFRLPQVVKCDADLKLQKNSQHYKNNSQMLNHRSVSPQPIQQKIRRKVQDEKRMENSEKLCHQKYRDRICNQATKVQVSLPFSSFSSLNMERRQQQRKEREARMVHTEITNFETNQKKLFTSSFASFSSSRGQPFLTDFPPGGSKQGCKVPGGGTELILKSNSKYIQEIRQRQKENAISCEQRQKRQDKFLVEQLKAREAEQDALHEELLVKRLTRQTKAEQRLAAQLLQIRKEREVIRENRLFREQQYQQRREKDFQEALYKESVLAQQAKLAREEEIRKEVEFCEMIAAERAHIKRKKHFESCKEVLEQIVALATKVGEHRLVTGNLIPEKMMRDWKELLFKGLPLYEPIKSPRTGLESSASQDHAELQKQELLNNVDYDEYTNMVGEWAWPQEDGKTRLPPSNNDILGHAVQRLRKIVHSSNVEHSSSLFPCFTIKACILGKFCSGKTNGLAKIAEALGIYVLSVDALIEEALQAYKKGENVTEQQGEKNNKESLTSSTLKIDSNIQEENRIYDKMVTTRARLGAAADKEMRSGNAIPNELLVEIVVEAISQVPAQSGWILDGFPYNITQAQLLEEALGGSVEGNEVVLDRTNLAANPDPPEPSRFPAHVLDLAVLLDIPDEGVVRHAYSHIDADVADVAGANQSDKAMYMTQILQRITTFHHTWPELEEWFDGKQNILVRVDASVDHDELYRNLESIFQQAMQKKQEALVHHPAKYVLPSIKASDTASVPIEPQPVNQPPVLTDEELGPTEPYSNALPSGHTSPSSVSKEDFQGVNKTVSSSRAYVDDPLPPEIPQYLCSYWDNVCNSYVNNIKKVLEGLRSQRSTIDHQLFDIRERYRHYLGRPDIKQELLSQWQKDFNSVPDDMRDSEDTRAELHLRLDELREQLWDITDKCKEENEQERATFMCNGWLDSNTVVLINYHCILIQVELSRFQETLDILRVYYLGMQKQLPLEPPSKCFSIPLVETPRTKAQDERCPDSSEIREDDEQEETAKSPHEKLIADCDKALKAIINLSSEETHHRKAKDKEKSLQEDNKASANANKDKKEKESSDKNGDDSDNIQTEEVRHSLFPEYAAAVNHEKKAAKLSIELVRSHGLRMATSLQNKAQDTFDNMEKWLKVNYLAEMKCIDQLSEVARHHIEAGSKLQYELVLEGSDFFINGDHLLEASLAPPPHPPPLEKPKGSKPTIAQLESLHHQLWSIAPSGLMSSSAFFDFVFIDMDRNILPKPWMTKVAEIVYLLTDEDELIDWKRFLLSASLLWPFPSVTQLLDVLERFKIADAGETGYINKKQYLKIELWFSCESVNVAGDQSEPVPYNRLANLRMFFFQLFADHSVSPPHLDYVSMLQYFAADPNPRQGFIRALSVVLGQNIEEPSMDHLVKSLPRMGEAPEPACLVPHRDYEEEATLCASSSCFRKEDVSIPSLLKVICHKVTKMKGSNPLPPGCLSQEEHKKRLMQVYTELGYKSEDCVPFCVLSKHPYTQMLMETSTHYQLVNIHQVLQDNPNEEEPINSAVF